MFSSILVPLDGSDKAARPLRSAAWLADKLNSQLHVVTVTSAPLPAAAALESLKVPPDLRTRVILHQLRGSAEQAILQCMEELQTDLLVLSAQGHSESDTGLGPVARSLLQQCMMPVLLAPPAFTERLPLRTAMIPVSGEQDTDEALGRAIALAKQLELELHVVHVVSPEAAEADYTSGMQYQDAVHHEFAERLNDLLRRACPHCGPDDFERVVAKVCLCRGKVADEIINMAEQTAADLLVTGWHGRLQPGRALYIKQLIENLTCPMLLFRSRAAPYFTLNVGEEFD